MSGVRAAKSISPESNQVVAQLGDAEIAGMQDALYDILANGMDAERSDVPTQEVERFLFEHARAPKSLLEFRAFFAAHKLTFARAVQPALSLPPIERPVPVERGMPARLPVELSVLDEREEPLPFEPFEITETRKRRPLRTFGLWAGGVLGAAAIAAAAVYGYTTLTQLQHELARTAADGRENQATLQALRDHAAGLESSVAATGEMLERVDQKSDLVLQTLTASEAKKSPRKYR